MKTFAVTSASREHGDQFSVCVDGQMIDVPGERGIGIVVVDYHTRNVSYKNMFDTSQSTTESQQLVKMMSRIRDGFYIVMGVKGEGAKMLSQEARREIAELGSNEIGKLECGDSWAMIVRKGLPSSVREARQRNAINIQRSDDF